MLQEEIFKTQRASITQCDHSESFYLRFESEVLQFRLCDLFSFKRKIMSYDVVELLDSSAPDIEIIHLPHCDRFLLLSIKEILEFRELLNGTFNTLALNSAIQKILRLSVFK